MASVEPSSTTTTSVALMPSMFDGMREMTEAMVASSLSAGMMTISFMACQHSLRWGGGKSTQGAVSPPAGPRAAPLARTARSVDRTSPAPSSLSTNSRTT